MARNQKRSESPIAVLDGQIHDIVTLQADTSTPGRLDGPEPDSSPLIPEMPLFLQLTEEEIQVKYFQINRIDNERLMDHQWTRADFHPVLDRYSNILPWDRNRVRLQVPEGVNDYINASPVSLTSILAKQGEIESRLQNNYICMQGPKRETIDHTWHMVWNELSRPDNTSPAVIIMLCPLRCADPFRPGETKEQCSTYFPLDENSADLIINETDVLGETFKATVKFVSRDPTPPGTDIEIRKLSMSVEGEDSEKIVWHFLYPSWPDFGALEEKNVASIVSLMTLSREKNGKEENPRLVHCSAGVGRTGTFVALEFLIGELQAGAWENWDVSEHSGQDAVYDTVHQLRKQRRTMVQSYEQFAFLYEVLRKTWEEMYGVSCVGGDHQHGGIRLKITNTDQDID